MPSKKRTGQTKSQEPRNRKSRQKVKPFPRFRIFILGAGFSKLAGLPLATELWPEILRRARNLTERAGKLNVDIEDYCKYLHDCCARKIKAEDISFEEFLQYLDVQHYLGLRGSDTWSSDGNEGTVVVKTLIGQILAERMPNFQSLPDAYKIFAEGLKPTDIVLTFNYDTLLEMALDQVERPYRLFPHRYTSVHKDLSIGSTDEKEVVLLKLHGSIDWFDRSQYQERKANEAIDDPSYVPPHPIFTDENMKKFKVKPLLSGPRRSDDPLLEMHRVGEFRKLYSTGILFHATPWILAPSTAKLVYMTPINSFFYGMSHGGTLNFGLSIIGYSLPLHDDYARQILYTFAQNYQGNYWGKHLHGLKKTPLNMVNLLPDAKATKQLKERFLFINWRRAKLHKNGFSANVARKLVY